jgi:hypothetical protein
VENRISLLLLLLLFIIKRDKEKVNIIIIHIYLLYCRARTSGYGRSWRTLRSGWRTPSPGWPSWRRRKNIGSSSIRLVLPFMKGAGGFYSSSIVKEKVD